MPSWRTSTPTRPACGSCAVGPGSRPPSRLSPTTNQKRRDHTGLVLGGNGAFLYLLLPVVPLFLGYQIVDRKRKSETFELPSFKTEYIVPAFLLAVSMNLLLLVLFRTFKLDYSD